MRTPLRTLSLLTLLLVCTPAAARAAAPEARGRAAAEDALAAASHDIQDGHLQPAIAKLLRCTHLDPSLAACPRALGIAYGRAGEEARAAAAYRGYLRLAPHAPDAARVQALIDAYAGR